jgi:CRP-like cAMP-binding protein
MKMINKFERLNYLLLKYVDFTEQELVTFNSLCVIKKFKQKEIIISANQQNTTSYFIVNGIIRSYVESAEGIEKTFNFRMENMSFSGYSFHNEYVSKLNVICMEDCDMILLPKEAMDYIIFDLKKGQKFEKLLADMHVNELMDYIIDNHTKNVYERYIEMNIAFPNIAQRIPQNIIASYLGVSQEYFSRLKKKSLRTENVEISC